MATINEKLQAIQNSKNAIKFAIEAKGVTDVGNKLSDYASKIGEISGGETIGEVVVNEECFTTPSAWDNKFSNQLQSLPFKVNLGSEWGIIYSTFNYWYTNALRIYKQRFIISIYRGDGEWQNMGWERTNSIADPTQWSEWTLLE